MKRAPSSFASALSLRSSLRHALVLVAGAWSMTSCAPSGFADPTIVQTVRILASSADQPYAPPGADVNLQVLAYDGRKTQTEPMTIYWLPVVCENPQDDAYYACFQQFANAASGPGAGGGRDAGADGGGGGGGLGQYIGPGGVLHGVPTGPSYTFRMPSDAVTSHPAEQGTPVPYGLAILFNVACAGHLQLVPIDPSNQNPQAVPLGCFDSSGNQLGPDDWVLGFTRIYAYDKVRNADPVISYVDVAGKHLPVTPQPGAPQVYTAPACSSDTGCLSMPVCTGSGSDCQVQMGPVVPASSWEVNPEQTDVHGNPVHEELWVDFYATFGNLGDDARLLYDPVTGSVGDPTRTDTTFQGPSTAGTGNIWMIVHDNRGGVAWVTIPVLVH
jgi:hypothetical protein